MIGAAASVALTAPWRWNLGPLAVSSSSVVRPFSLGVGFLLLAAACSPAIWRAVRQASIPGFYLVMAMVMWVLTWGPAPTLLGKPALEQGPYAWLMLLPGVDGLRVPARFWMMTVLCLCVALGVLLAAALRRMRRPAALTVGVAAAIGLILDGWSTATAPSLLPTAPRPDLLRGGIALTLPLGAYEDRDTAAQFEAIEGGWASVNGHSGYEPPHYELLRIASRQASSLVLAPLLSRGDLNVILYESWPEQDALIEGQPGARLVGRGNGLRQYFIPRRGELPPSEPSGTRHRIASTSVSCVPLNAPFLQDGDPATRWGCGPQSPDQHVTVDLGRVVVVGEVVPALSEAWPEYPRQLIVETSRDGDAWEEAWNRGVLPEMFEALVSDPKLTRVVLAFPPREGRYVRLRLGAADEKSLWSIAELEVWSGR